MSRTAANCGRRSVAVREVEYVLSAEDSQRLSVLLGLDPQAMLRRQRRRDAQVTGAWLGLLLLAALLVLLLTARG